MTTDAQDKLRVRLVGILLVSVLYFIFFLSVQSFSEDKHYRSMNVHSLRLVDHFFALFRDDNVQDKYFARDHIATFLMQSDHQDVYEQDTELKEYLSQAKVVMFEFDLFGSPESCRGLLIEDLMRPKGQAETVYFVVPAKPCEFVALPSFFHVDSLSDERFTVTFPYHKHTLETFFECIVFSSDRCYPLKYQMDFWSKFGDPETQRASRWRAGALDQVNVPDLILFHFFRNDIGSAATPSALDKLLFRGQSLEERIKQSEERVLKNAPTSDTGASFFGVEIAGRFVPIAVAILLFYQTVMGFQVTSLARPGDKKLSQVPFSAQNWQGVLLSVVLTLLLPASVFLSALVTIGLAQTSFFGFVVSPLTGDFFNSNNGAFSIPSIIEISLFSANLMFALYLVSIVTSLAISVQILKCLFLALKRHYTGLTL
ncbi:hypothetical protein [uncultured Roseobacter sp.]|uniref:hypothetical protein n=1 Tax=uncultured Roseobacter sp. TaxID=114847 RepID=UPI002637AFD4|nr:hypothetical protein [uncultured Roseobacter sp.]